MAVADAAATADFASRETRDEWLDRNSGRIMVMPAVVILLAFAIFPLIVSIYLSLCRFALAGGSFTLTFIGLFNYKRLLFGSQQYHLIGTMKPLETPQWIALAAYAVIILYWLARYVASGFSVLGFVGRLISASLATGIVIAALATIPAGGYEGTLLTTCFYVLVGVSAQFLIGLSLALLCAQPIRARNFFRVVFFIPLMVTPVGVAYMFRMLADMQKGPFAPLSAAFGLTAWSWATQAWSARLMVLIGDTWQWAPFMFIVLLAAIENQPRDQLEAARLDGASGWQVFRDITWPSIAPIAATVVLIRLIEAFKIIDIPNVLTAGGPGLATEIDDAARLHRLAHPGSRRLGGDRLPPPVRGDGHLRIILQLCGPLDAEAPVSDAVENRSLARRLFEAKSLDGMAAVPRFVVYVLLGLWTLVVLFPLYWVLVTSFKVEVQVDSGPYFLPFVDFTPTLEAWNFMLLKNNTIGPYLNSIVVALSSTLLALLIGSLAAYALVRIRFQVKLAAVLTFLVLLVAVIIAVAALGVPWPAAVAVAIAIFLLALGTFVRRFNAAVGNNDIEFWMISNRIMPPIVAVLPIYVMFQHLKLLDTQIALIATYTGVNLPIVVWLTRDFFAGIPLDLEESAEIDGASKFRVFFTIALPLVRSGLAATFMLVLILAWNEFLLALFLTNANAQTMPVLVAAQNTTRGPQWWYMSVLIVIMIAPVIIIAAFLQKHIARGLLVGAVKG